MRAIVWAPVPVLVMLIAVLVMALARVVASFSVLVGAGMMKYVVDTARGAGRVPVVKSCTPSPRTP